MKRTREEVQYGARSGPGGVGGSGGGGGGGGGGGSGIGAIPTTAGVVTGTANVSTGALNIGTVVPGAHTTASAGGGGNSSTTLNVGLGAGNIATAGSIAHHRILTPQHGGAQTIAYLPSTTPVTATNLKSSAGIVADSSAGGGVDGSNTISGSGVGINASGGGGGGRITQLSGNTLVTTGGGGPGSGNTNTVVQPQTVQYSTCKYILEYI